MLGRITRERAFAHEVAAEAPERGETAADAGGSEPALAEPFDVRHDVTRLKFGERPAPSPEEPEEVAEIATVGGEGVP